MDGLEATEIPFSYVNIANDIFRLDSFYFSKEFLREEKIILCRKNELLLNMVNSLRSFGAYSLNNDVEYLKEGIPFVRGVNLKGGTIDFSDMVYISEKSHKLLWKSEVKPKTVLLSMSGTIGDVAFASENLQYPLNSNQDIAKIDLSEALNPYYLFAFLRSKFGQNYLLREARGSVQQHVFLSQIERFKIPVLSDNLQLKIETVVKLFYSLLDESKLKYQSAETLLHSYLGLENYTPDTTGIAVRSFSASFCKSGRLDSEYYQPKFEEIMQAVSIHNQKKLGNIVGIKKSIEPGSDYYCNEGIPFVRVSNLSKYEISEPDIKIPHDTVKNIFEFYPKKDTVLLSKDGSVGIAYKVEEDMRCVTSGAILHLNVKNSNEILPDFLTLVLNSKVVQMQAERDAGGSIIQHWKPSEIADVVIPVLGMDQQLEITDKIKESFALRKKSSEFLALAKTAVEVAIEQGENKTMAMLEGIV